MVVGAGLLGRFAPFLSGILSGFPAVFFTTLVFIHISARQRAVIAYSSTALLGIAVTGISVAGTGTAAFLGWPWPTVVLFGLTVYFLIVFVAVLKTRHPATPSDVKLQPSPSPTIELEADSSL